MSDSTYDGGCHCGAVGFRYTTVISPEDWSVRACQCRFCRMHDALSTSDPGGNLQIFAPEPTALRRYRFALKTADFLICTRCGIYIGAVIDATAARFGIINTHALNETPPGIAAVGAISYDNEDASGRINRREECWTPVSAVPW
ncbi:MAG: hypothetical protein OES10_04700 [Gammaproteobacteria bacterium]|nr:hypothetical protein [Gammaproteobacteria bacterium]